VRDDDQLCVKVGPTAAGRWEGLKIRRGSSNVWNKICPPVEIELPDLPKSAPRLRQASAAADCLVDELRLAAALCFA
jgi:hypothetical protein